MNQNIIIPTTIPSDIVNTMYTFLNVHEISCITFTRCPICTDFRHMKLLDEDVDHNLIKNYCKNDKAIVNKIPLKKLTSKSQRIHVIGDIWPLINSFKYRKFAFFCKSMRVSNKDSICITDATDKIDKIDNKMIITQGYKYEYNIDEVDYLLIEKKYIGDYFEMPFDKNIIPVKGYLVIDVRNSQRFYTEQ